MDRVDNAHVVCADELILSAHNDAYHGKTTYLGNDLVELDKRDRFAKTPMSPSAKERTDSYLHLL